MRNKILLFLCILLMSIGCGTLDLNTRTHYRYYDDSYYSYYNDRIFWNRNVIYRPGAYCPPPIRNRVSVNKPRVNNKSRNTRVKANRKRSSPRKNNRR